MDSDSYTIKVSQSGIDGLKDYLEYKRIVGEDDGGKLFTPSEYEEYKNKVLPLRMKNRVYTSWTNLHGVDCKLVGPETGCFCSHRYKQHKTDFDILPDSCEIQLPCKVKNCRCLSFHYIPLLAGEPIRCTCKHSAGDHDPRYPYKCHIGNCKRCEAFKSSYTCQCGDKYSEHKMTIESESDRQKRGHPIGKDVPYQAMGGITGFSSLCDGYERMDPSGKAFRNASPETIFSNLRISHDTSDMKDLRKPEESELDYYHRKYEKLKKNKSRPGKN